MRGFRLLKKQVVLAFLSLFLLSACIGGEKQTDKGQGRGSSDKGPSDHGDSDRPEACKGGKIKDIQEDNAPFLVSETAKVKMGVVDDENNLPKEFHLTLKACVKDSIKEDASVPITSFTIKYETANDKGKIVSNEISRSTDDSGCLHWKEVYPYKYVVQPFWVRLDREVIKENGPYAGKVTLPTAVNFWLEGEEANAFQSVMDLRRRYYQNDAIFKKYPIVDRGLQCLTDKEDRSRLQLWAPEVDAQFSQGSSSDKGQLSSESHPAVRQEIAKAEAEAKAKEEEAKKEEKTLSEDLEKTRQEAAMAAADQKNKYETKLRELEEKLAEAQTNKKIALSKLSEAQAKLIEYYKNLCTDSAGNGECFRRNLTMELTIPLKLRAKKLNGALKTTPVNGGSYNITAQLIAEYPEGSKKYYRIHNKALLEEEVSMSFQGGQGTDYLSPTFDLKIPYFNTTANYKLVLEIKEANGGLPFRKFQGVYNLKELEMSSVKRFKRDSSLEETYSSISNKSDDSAIKIIEDMKIEYIYTHAKNEARKKDKKIDTILKNLNFTQPHMSVSIQTVRFANTKNDEDCKNNETIVKREVEYVATACLKDNFAKIQETKFRIFRKDQTSENGFRELFRKDGEEHLRTNQANCIAWRDTIDHKNFDRQIYFSREMYFILEEQELYGEALIAVSPWHNQFQFFQDITQLHVSNIRTNSKGVSHPRFVIPQFKSVNFYPSYIIDKFLNLKIKYNVRFLFQPIITRPDSLAWGKLPRSRELARDGYYLTRVLIARSPQETRSSHAETESENNEKKAAVLNNSLKLDFQNLEYIHHIDTVVKVEANFVNISVPIEFNTRQLLYLGSRNVVILQMAPANPDKYVFKEVKGDGACHVDTKKTKWEPYLDHDLIALPFAGPMNVPNWTNWNVLQEACKRNESGAIVNCLETDKIIDQSEEGSKFRHFDMDRVVNASIEKDGGKNQATSAQRAGFSVQSGPGGDRTGVSSQPVAGNTDKEPAPIIKAVGGSDSCKNAHDNLLEKKLQKHSKNAGQTRVVSLNGAEITFKREKTEQYQHILGTDECQADPSCYDMQNEAASFFGYIYAKDDVGPYGSRLENFWKEDERSPKDRPQPAGPGTETCVNIKKMEKKNGEFIFDASDSKTREKKISDTLEKFAEVNSLKVVDFSQNGAQDKFLEDINRESGWINEIAKQMEIRKKGRIMFSFYSYLADLFEGIYDKDEDKEEFHSLLNQINEECEMDFKDYHASFSTESQEETFLTRLIHRVQASFSTESQKEAQIKSWEKFYKECAISIFRDHLNDRIAALKEPQPRLTDDDLSPEEFDKRSRKLIENQEALKSLNSLLSSSSSLQERSKKIALLNAWDKGVESLFLEKIISGGIDDNERVDYISRKVIKEQDFLTSSFVHSLCGFWFHSFLKDYLQTEQMQSAFEDYVRKLDYKLILESDLPSHEADKRDSILLDLFKMIPSEGGLEQCAKSYRNCALQDYCSAFFHDSSRPYYKNNLCEHSRYLIAQDSSCMDFASRECQEQGSAGSNLCRANGSFASEEQCKRALKSHCEINPKDTMCREYNDMRCLSNYKSCSGKEIDAFAQAKEDFINHFQNVEKKWTASRSPLQTCLRNPFEFFHFENKMIVGGLSGVKFQSGLMQHFSLNGSFSIGSYMNWGSERKTGVGMKAGMKGGSIAFMEKLNFWKRLASLLSLDADISIGISSAESNSSRRSVDTRMANALFLVASEAAFEMDVTHFKRCLVIKPRPNAFTAEYGEKGLPKPYDESDTWPESFHGKDFKKIALARPGLMLCNPIKITAEDKAETIKENYYYISQSNVRTETSHLLNLYDIANRPFVIVLRGRKEFLKYSYLLRQTTEGRDNLTGEISASTEAPGNLFIHYPYPVENMAGLSLAMRAFKDTGFHPGIYTYPSILDSKAVGAKFVDQKESFTDTILKFVHDHVNLFNVPPSSERPISIKP